MKSLRLILLICLLPLVTLAFPLKASTRVFANKQVPRLFQDPDVYLTVSANASVSAGGKLNDRKLILNWYNFIDIQSGDFVGLYLEDPQVASEAVLNSPSESVQISSSASSGLHITSIKYDRQNLTAQSNHCVGYWIAYVRMNADSTHSVIKSKCLQIYPRWMDDLRSTIGDKPLNALMIPGTHDAGAWRHYDGQPSENVITKYVICQEDSVYDQLMHGIRYLDIRAANYSGEFWVNHGQFQVHPLIEILQNITAFLTQSPNEVLFVDFHEFPVGFSDSQTHIALANFIQKELGPFLVSRNQADINVTPNQMKSLGKNIILGYANDATRNQFDFLWKNVNHAWAETTDVAQLESFQAKSLDTTLGCSGTFWSGMVELTPTASDIITRPNFGLRGFAGMVNYLLAGWYRRPEWYSKAAIVASDFYLENNLIQMSVEVNKNNASVCYP